MSENKNKLFLLISFVLIFVGIIVWLIVRQPAPDRQDVAERNSLTDAITQLGETEPVFPDFIQNLVPFNEAIGDHSTLPHGHDSDNVGYSNIINPNWLSNNRGCNLFSLNIFDADCDGIPDWLEQYHGTDTEDPESPYHQGAWNYDNDGIFHGMDGHYSCDMYPTLLNCNQRISSNNETTTETQNSDGGCVPDVIEIIRGTNPLDGTDDHNPDIYGRRIPSTQCSFGETTLNAVTLSNLPPVQEIDYSAPILAANTGFDLQDLTSNLGNLIDDLEANFENLNDYNDIDYDANPVNTWGTSAAVNAFGAAVDLFQNHEDYIKSIEGFAKDGFHSAALADETFTIQTSAGTSSYLCEVPGPMFIPYPWTPTSPTSPQDISVTLSDEAGNTSPTNVVEQVTIDPDRWSILIERANNQPLLTSATSVVFEVSFNHPVSNVTLDDFTIRTTGTLEANLASLTQVNNQNYRITVNQLEGEGILGLDIALIHNIEGPTSLPTLNPGYALASRQSYIVDTIPPETPDIVAPAPGETIGDPSRVVMNCENAADVVTVTVGNATGTHTCQVPGLAFIPLPNIASGAPVDIEVTVTDQVGQTSPTATIPNITFDPAVRPGVSFVIPTGTPDITNDTSLVFDILFTRNVNNVDMSDFTLVTTGSAQGMITELTQVSPQEFRMTVSSVQGDGLLSIFLKESHDIETITGQIPINRGDTRARDMYRVDQSSPDPVAVVRPVDNGTAANPSGIMVYCQSGWSSFDYEPFDYIQQEFEMLASHTYAVTNEFTQRADFDPALEWQTRNNVKFYFDMASSTWQNGLAQIRGWVDTNGLTIRPELRYTDVTNVSYANQFRAFCNQQAFNQANFEDGTGWVWDLLFMLFNAGSYGRTPVHAYYINPSTGALELDNVIQTPPGIQVPFVISVPFDDPNDVDQAGNPIQVPDSDRLNPDGLYAFAIVDPNTHVPLIDLSFDIPGIGEVSIDIDIPIPDPTGLVASHIFSGPSCLDMFNRPTPILNLDLGKSTITGGFRQ